MKKIVALIIVIMLGCILTVVVSDMPTFGSDDDPANNRVADHYIKKSHHQVESSNMVNAIVVDYRGYDTLIETVVLFSISISVMALLYKR